MNPRPVVIGIAGPSCGGKTVLAEHVASALGAEAVTLFALDAYYRDLSALTPAERALQNFDAPDALDWDLLRGDVQRLAWGETIETPVYDFAQHIRAARRQPIVPRFYLIVEGLFALYDAVLRESYATAVFVDARDSVCLERRIARDCKARGRTRESVLRQYYATVRPMAERYVLPTRAWADLLVNGEDPLEYTTAQVIDHIR
jgi:uridine kinase